MITENLSTLKIHKLTKAQYERELEAGRIDENAIYLTPDEATDMSVYATVDQLNLKADGDHTHDDIYYKEEIDLKLAALADGISPDMTGAIEMVQNDLNAYKESNDAAVQEARDIAEAAVVANAAITGGTHAKITYDSKGLVVSGESLVADDIPVIGIEKVSELQNELDKKQNALEFNSDYNATSNKVATMEDINAIVNSVDFIELITIEDIDAICGASIQAATLNNEVKF